METFDPDRILKVKENMAIARKNRGLMKSVRESDTDMDIGLPQPPLFKAAAENARIIALPKTSESVIVKRDILTCLKDRRSHRAYKNAPLTLEELSFLLWATQGVDGYRSDGNTLRPVPSAFAMHPFETYVAVNNVDPLDKGIYRYLPLDHKLEYIYSPEDLPKKLVEAAFNQKSLSMAAATFIWSYNAYRSEYRYGIISLKHTLLGAGHVCQNIYLACEAIGCGTCAIGWYDQKQVDKLIKVDGEDEFTIYIAPVGKI